MKHESIHYHEDRRHCPDCIGNGRCPGHAVTLTTMASVPLDELKALEACAAALRDLYEYRYAIESEYGKSQEQEDEWNGAQAALARLDALKEPKP